MATTVVRSSQQCIQIMKGLVPVVVGGTMGERGAVGWRARIQTHTHPYVQKSAGLMEFEILWRLPALDIFVGNSTYDFNPNVEFLFKIWEVWTRSSLADSDEENSLGRFWPVGCLCQR